MVLIYSIRSNNVPCGCNAIKSLFGTLRINNLPFQASMAQPLSFRGKLSTIKLFFETLKRDRHESNQARMRIGSNLYERYYHEGANYYPWL